VITSTFYDGSVVTVVLVDRGDAEGANKLLQIKTRRNGAHELQQLGSQHGAGKMTLA